jgi:N-methylhydantoinase A/oxoprolinase/acetone carboxylase beta subunit/N-methylhydantoinase B/oxoprolinase/acetone carboxylase alpha subunit
MTTFQIGIDVGGTFTDCVCVRPDRAPTIVKVLTTPNDPSDGVVAGVEALANQLELGTDELLAQTQRIVHGTTVATNALVERRGTPTAILTSRGHEDTFVIGKVSQKAAGLSERERVHMSRLDLADPPLVVREWTWGVSERVDYKGSVVCALDEDGVREAGAEMVAAGIHAVAVCFLWSFMNPQHEQRAAELLREVGPDLYVVCSSDIAPVLGEYERTATTVLSAYLGPPLDAYLTKLEDRLRERGYRYPLMIMQTAGGLGTATAARARPATVLDSGPVGGVLGAAWLAGLSDRRRIIATDVGGTTFDVGLLDDGRPLIDNSPIIDKYQFHLPKVQITSIGSGGGSIAWVDETGVLKVGPQSAGADPGPACYGRGGTQATVTDANLVLGYLSETAFLGGEMALDRSAAEAALDKLAKQLGITRIEVADGIRRILDSQMADLVRRVTIDRGYDPREFALFAFGGMGPTHAARYAADLGVADVVIPADATAFSALGMLAAPQLHVSEVSEPRRTPFDEEDARRVTEIFRGLEQQALEQFADEGVDAADVELRRIVLVRFQMQVHEIEIEVPSVDFALPQFQALEADFLAAYVTRYGEGSAYPDAGIEVVTYRVEARVAAEAIHIGGSDQASGSIPSPRSSRQAWFEESSGFLETNVYGPEAVVPGAQLTGPAIIERMGDTVVLPPGCTGRVDELGNLHLVLQEQRASDRPEGELDPITYEVIKNRLWAINDEQAMTAAKIAGTPIIYEAFDFNAGIADADGRGVFTGVYVTHVAAALDLSVSGVINSFGTRGEIHDGDMFVTNDAWVGGAIHPSDIVVLSPVHYQGEIVAWTSIVMHDADVGGPVPGSFVVGAKDTFSECPIYPPLKLMSGGRYCQEIEDLFLRNSRTPALNALNMRARVACQTIARRRLLELIETYGVSTLTQVFARIHDEVHTVVSRRLADIPDGSWREHGYVDHDGVDNLLYEVKLELRKQGTQLTFDFTGTCAQAPGIINGSEAALRGGVMAAVLPMLCFDVPWATGALDRTISIVAEPGTLNNATHPAPITGGSVFGEAITENLASACLAKMLASSESTRDEAMATWYPFANVQVIAGLDQFSRPMAAVLLDIAAGGAGARSFKDGIDCGGWIESVAIAMPNVESNERVYPILEVYRRRRADTGGPGRFRGGVGLELLIVPHDNPVPLQEVILTSGVSQPEAHGIGGGLPGSAQGNLVLRGSKVWELLEHGVVPTSMDQIEHESLDVLQAKDVTVLGDRDAHLAWYSGGGGYGDPVRRDPELVARDVSKGLCSPQAARDVYAVALTSDCKVDFDGTAALREAARRARLERARPSSELLVEVGTG